MEKTLLRRSPSPSSSFAEGPAAPVLEGPTTSEADWFLFEDFIQLRNRCRGALVALSDRVMIMNASAGEMLLPSDRPQLWALAQDAVKEGHSHIGELPLSSGTSVMARYRPVLDGQVIIGVVVQFSVKPQGRAGARSKLSRAADPGWWSLTNTERAVAEVVAGGLTNREAGRRLHMSPHTVDAHLRHIFRKLDINSRVELARFVGEHYEELYHADDNEASSAITHLPA